jgi:hypothetical protein
LGIRLGLARAYDEIREPFPVISRLRALSGNFGDAVSRFLSMKIDAVTSPKYLIEQRFLAATSSRVIIYAGIFPANREPGQSKWPLRVALVRR